MDVHPLLRELHEKGWSRQDVEQFFAGQLGFTPEESQQAYLANVRATLDYDGDVDSLMESHNTVPANLWRALLDDTGYG
jgi:hypothetical protein